MTRLIEPGLIDAEVAAELAGAMIRCTVSRLAARGPLTLAVSPDGAGPAFKPLLDQSPAQVVDQGAGDLGERIRRVWQRIGTDQPLAIFGIDTPDMPVEGLVRIAPALRSGDLAIGATTDGGYWCLAAPVLRRSLFEGIDWGTERVYDQTLHRASVAGLGLCELPNWYDVDRPADLRALRDRLASTLIDDVKPDQALQRLAAQLEQLLDW